MVNLSLRYVYVKTIHGENVKTNEKVTTTTLQSNKCTAADVKLKTKNNQTEEKENPNKRKWTPSCHRTKHVKCNRLETTEIVYVLQLLKKIQ